jgi:hypothetical protein
VSRGLLIRRWITRTFSGRAIAAGAVVKLAAYLLRVAFGAWPLFELLDTAGDVSLMAGAVVVGYRLFVDAKRQLLWRVRRKLTLSYIFIGFVPVLPVVVFFLVLGLVLFYNVSQYVAVARINSLVEQTAFLAESAAVGLQDADTAEEIQRRLQRRQAGAAGAYPFVSYAIVPAETCTDADLNPLQRLRVVREPRADGFQASHEPEAR